VIEKGLSCLKGWFPDPDDFAGDGRPAFSFGLDSLAPSYTQEHGGLVIQSSNDCVANALATAMRDRMLLQNTLRPRLPSRRWIYYWTRKLSGDEANDNGSQPGLAAEAVNTFGWCAEEHFSYNDHDVFTEPGAEAARFAYDQRGKVKLHTLYGYQDLKLALAHDLAVTIACQVDKPFEKLAAGASWNGLVGPSVGGHMFRLVGYDDAKQSFLVMNTWGDTWADKGFGLIGYEAASEAGSKMAIDWVPSLSEDNPMGGALCACSGLPLPSPASCSAPSSKAVSTRRHRCPIGRIALGRATDLRTSVVRAASPRRTARLAPRTSARFRSRRRTRRASRAPRPAPRPRRASETHDVPLRAHTDGYRYAYARLRRPGSVVSQLRSSATGARTPAQGGAATD